MRRHSMQAMSGWDAGTSPSLCLTTRINVSQLNYSRMMVSLEGTRQEAHRAAFTRHAYSPHRRDKDDELNFAVKPKNGTVSSWKIKRPMSTSVIEDFC